MKSRSAYTERLFYECNENDYLCLNLIKHECFTLYVNDP